MSTRTITLTGRPPVKIDEDQWPVIASASDHEYDGEYDFQANLHSRWSVHARQHEDGRTVVYAVYSFNSAFTGARCYRATSGKLLTSEVAAQSICDAIAEVCSEIRDAECEGDDADRWPALAAECIADMPAETI